MIPNEQNQSNELCEWSIDQPSLPRSFCNGYFYQEIDASGGHLHCSDRERNEEAERERISNSWVTVRLSSTTAAAETNEDEYYPEENEPSSSEHKERSGCEAHRLHCYRKVNIWHGNRLNKQPIHTQSRLGMELGKNELSSNMIEPKWNHSFMM